MKNKTNYQILILIYITFNMSYILICAKLVLGGYKSWLFYGEHMSDIKNKFYLSFNIINNISELSVIILKYAMNKSYIPEFNLTGIVNNYINNELLSLAIKWMDPDEVWECLNSNDYLLSKPIITKFKDYEII